MRAMNKAISIMVLGLFVNAGTPVETLVPIQNIFSPEGFDSNDNVEVIVEGQLPNLCHKTPMKKVTIKGNTIDIKVTALSYHESNPFCPEMVVPFLETVSLGVLDKGNYKINVNGKTVFAKDGVLTVNESTSDAVDESVYARVDYIEKSHGSRTVKLKGYNPSDCFVLEKIEVFHNNKDVYSILPKMKQISDFCPMKMIPFEYDVEVPKTLNKSRVLLHVRAMEGKSINTIFDNK
ncbi:MAG: hypothetical protein VX341_01335 [Bdellovibrionota bacterium]|nr:hypothetical protein [Bdellovibrionota bacterium]